MSEERARLLLILGGSILLLLFFLPPALFMAATGFAESPDYLSPRAGFDFTLRNYLEVLTAENLHFPAYLRNSVIVSAAAALGSVLVGALAAYAVTRLSFPGKMALLLAALALSMFPPISLIGYLFRLMTDLGWINSYQALIFPYVAWILPLSLWILVSYFARIPRELDRAALIDGCTRGQALVKVIVPVAMPGLLSTALLAFVFAFNEFLFALMLTTDERSRTIPVGVALFEGLHGEIPWGKIMAASVVAAVPVVLVTILFQRRIIQGLTRGAVKG